MLSRHPAPPTVRSQTSARPCASQLAYSQMHVSLHATTSAGHTDSAAHDILVIPSGPHLPLWACKHLLVLVPGHGSPLGVLAQLYGELTQEQREAAA
jgi:hypothetical protein